MKIEGKQLAKKIFTDLKIQVENLRKKNISPTLTVILLGEDPASVAYVNQKKIKSDLIGAKCDVHFLDTNTTQDKLFAEIEKLNSDKNIHGIIVQRPLPPQIDSEKIDEAVDPKKDIDGFHPQTQFFPPISEAVLEVMKSINVDPKGKKVVVIGRGETGGKPIANTLIYKGASVTVVHSKTKDISFFTKQAEIIISCVGKPNIVTPEMVTANTILLGVGMYKGEDGKLHGDYDEEKISKIVKYYTPVPGGMGPVNVACLFKNLLQATSAQG